jgi:hypothetical protein
MNSKYAFALLTVTLALSLFAAAPASAQMQLLNIQQDVPMAATLDNPCTAGTEAIAFTGTTHVNQQVWSMPGGSIRLILGEVTTLSGTDILLGVASPLYTAGGGNETDAEFNPGAASIYNYKQVISSASQDNFHTIVTFDFDPNSLCLNLSLQGSCSDGSPTAVSPAPAAISAVPLGQAANFGVLAASTATNTGTTTVNGNVGVSPGTAVTGFPPGVVVGGSIRSNDAMAIQAQSDLTTAWNTITATACLTDLTGVDLGNMTLRPGVYCFASSAQLTGTLTLDAGGDPNASFIFKMGSTLTTASASRVLVINGGSSSNVFWQVGSSATLGTTTSFSGNILALASITLTTGTTVSGRALARTAAVTMDTNTFTQ